MEPEGSIPNSQELSKELRTKKLGDEELQLHNAKLVALLYDYNRSVSHTSYAW
jgi:hypothetical protein